MLSLILVFNFTFISFWIATAQIFTDPSLRSLKFPELLKKPHKPPNPNGDPKGDHSKAELIGNHDHHQHERKKPRNQSKIYTFKPFYKEIPSKNIALERAFRDIIRNSTCTIYQFGEDNEWNPLFHQFHDLCHTDYDGYCVKIITSVNKIGSQEPYHWEWTDFNYQTQDFYFTLDGNGNFKEKLRSLAKLPHHQPAPHSHQDPSPKNNTFRAMWSHLFRDFDWPYYKIFGSSPKYADKCLVLFRSTGTDQGRRRKEEPPKENQDLLNMPYHGRLTPDFTFIYAKNLSCIKASFNSDNLGASVILIATATHLSMLKNEGCSEDVAFKSIPEIRLRWLRIHGEIKRFKYRSHSQHDLTAWNGSFTFRICGGTPLVEQYIKLPPPPGQSQPQRIWDPQELCVYETILTKHLVNFTNEFRREPFEWPFQMEYLNILPRTSENDLKVGKFGKVYLPFTLRHQGFIYNIFLDKKQTRVEFDMTSLLDPFDLYVWVNFIAALVVLSILWKISTNSFQILFLIGVMLEQEVKVRKAFFSRSHQVRLIAGLWLMTAISIRQCYTGKMFSAITAEVTPHTPETFKELLAEPASRKFDIFVPSDQMQALLFSGKENENITADMFWSVTKGINSTQLREIIQGDTNTNQIFLLQGSLNKRTTKHHPRIAFISYTHPSKLQFAGTPNPKVGEIENKSWIPPFPYDAVLRMLGRRKFIRNYEKPIRNYPWMYFGKRNYFTDIFAKDLSALVESGIHLRWEYLMCKYTEKDYLIEENKKSSNFSWNFYSAACRKLGESLRKPMTVKKATNASISVIWVLFFVCLIISFAAYLKEIVRFDFAGRKCPCCGYSAFKYKKD